MQYYNCSDSEGKEIRDFFALMTPGFRLYSIIGAEKEGNFLLHKKQYLYTDCDIARWIVTNKIINQQRQLKRIRSKSPYDRAAIEIMQDYIEKLQSANSNEFLAYEGLAAKIYFEIQFRGCSWNGRQPRLKKDYINSVLDIGYTVLFAYIDALLECFGFDTYCGVYHKQFYMRKSLVCDLIEPFRCIIDQQIKKACNLKQIKESDFLVINHQYQLKWEETARYISFLLEPIIECRDDIFVYVQSYYRSFMKEVPIENYSMFYY